MLWRPNVVELHVVVLPDPTQMVKVGSDHFENLTNALDRAEIIIVTNQKSFSHLVVKLQHVRIF